MDYDSALKSALKSLGVEDLHGSSDQEIEEGPEESVSEEDEQMEEDPEESLSGEDEQMEKDPEEIEIAKKKTKEFRASRARMAQHFGEVPGVPVGASWRLRRGCYDAGIHCQSSAGIQGTKAKGAFSVVISCYYTDDEDFGDKITYTGAGGRSSKSGWPSRGDVQIRDQEWTDQGNGALRKSCDTGKPVRVVRSWKCVSGFAPASGYRYDGLYTVTYARREKNKAGDFYVCRYDMERIPGQPPLPRRSRFGYYIEPRSSPASIATSDTVVSPSRTSTSRKLDACSEDDPPIHADAAHKKRKLIHRLPSPPSPSSSPAAQSSASAPVTFQTLYYEQKIMVPLNRSLVRNADMSPHSDDDEEQEQEFSDFDTDKKEKEDPDLDGSPEPYVLSRSSFSASQSQL